MNEGRDIAEIKCGFASSLIGAEPPQDSSLTLPISHALSPF